MKRLHIGILLLSICACQSRTVTVVTTPKEEPTQVVVISPADQTAIDEHLKKQAEANATVKHSAAGEILLHEGYSYMKLMRDSSSKLSVNCVANGKVICLNLDTGFTDCAIANEVAKDLNLKITESNVVLIAAGSEQHKTRLGTISNFRIGDAPAAALDFHVTDFSAIRAEAKKRGLTVPDGVLGGSWFASHQCVIDFKCDVLYLRSPQQRIASFTPNPDQATIDHLSSKEIGRQHRANDDGSSGSSFAKSLIKDGYTYLKLVRGQNDPELYLNCTANGKPLCLQIDSGASTVSISQQTAQRLALNLTDSTTETVWLGDKPLKAKQTSLSAIRFIDGPDSISLGGVPVLDLSATRSRAKQIADVDFDGFLSAQLLKLYSCVLDYRQAGLYIQFPYRALSNAFTGTWQANTVKRNGKPDSTKAVSQWMLTFVNGNVHLQAPAAKWNCTLSLPANSLNGTIDCTLQFSANAVFTENLHGIFDVDSSNSKFRLCLSADSADRPSKFESTESNKAIVIEFERAPKK